MKNDRGGVRQKSRRLLIFVTVLSVFCIRSSPLFGAISETSGIGDRASALGGAVTALPNDPTAVYYNPAGLTLLDGFRLWYDHTILNGFGRIDNITEGKRSRFILESHIHRPTLIATGQIRDVHLGIGLLGISGIAARYASDIGESRFFGFDTKVLQATLTPAIAYRLAPNLSLGATFEISAFTKIENRQLIGDGFVGDLASFRAGLPPGAISTRDGNPDGSFLTLNDRSFPTGLKPNNSLTADFRNFSFTAGLLYRPLPWMQVGLTYRERFEPRTVGRAIVRFDEEIKTALGLQDDQADFKTNFLTRPRTVNLGVALRPRPRLIFLLDGQWSGWKDFRDLEISLGQGRQGPGLLGQNTLVIPTRMHDIFGIRVGMEYEVLPDRYLRLGYWLDKHPQSDRHYLTPTFPNDAHYLSAGFGWENFFDLPLYLGLYVQVGIAEPRRLSRGEGRSAGGLKNFDSSGGGRLQFAPNDVGIRFHSARFYSFGLTLEYRFGPRSERARESFL
ncbi:MAG: OmpP1/FadL family transporter [Candidatus Binatia bacterium]